MLQNQAAKLLTICNNCFLGKVPQYDFCQNIVHMLLFLTPLILFLSYSCIFILMKNASTVAVTQKLFYNFF